jgi:predicted enzyme related to lactoylglutathione lyase
MTNQFVWFHNGSEKPAEAVQFYEKLLGWKGAAGPGGVSMLSSGAGPFAGVAPRDNVRQGWVPYVQVDDLDRATEHATKLGAKVVQTRTSGPAGDFTVIKDPGGATLALWRKAA